MGRVPIHCPGPGSAISFLKEKGVNGCGPFLNIEILDACHVLPTEKTTIGKVASQESRILKDKMLDARRAAVQKVVDSLSPDSKQLFARYAGLENTTEVNADQLLPRENFQQDPFPPSFFNFYAFYVRVNTREFRESLDLEDAQYTEIIKIKQKLWKSCDKAKSKIEYRDAENLAYRELLKVLSPAQQTTDLRTLSCNAFEKDFVTPFSDPLFVSFLTLSAAEAQVMRNVAKLEADELEAIEKELNRTAFESLVQGLSAESALEMRKLLGDLW